MSEPRYYALEERWGYYRVYYNRDKGEIYRWIAVYDGTLPECGERFSNIDEAIARARELDAISRGEAPDA